MQRARTWITLSSFIVTAGLAGAAHAKSEYVAYIPNGNVKTCSNCHTGGDTTKLNGFGNDSSNQVAKPNTDWWPALADLDSDGDGQTNGQELGDPCNEWLIGLDPPRTSAISNPGDALSKSADPDSPPCGAGGAGGGSGGSGTITTSSSSSTTGAGGAPPGMSGEGAGIPQSTGAGKADPPVYSTSASCSTNLHEPPRSWASSLLFLVALTLFARSRRTHPR